MRRPAWLLPLVLCAACGDDDGTNTNQNQNNTNGNVSLPLCGNGVLETGETCDEGAANSDVDPGACRTDCRPAYCGDGVVDLTEQCDDGGANSDRLANACREACVEPTCGDGVIDADEDCDDGNALDGDGCSAACGVETYWTCSGLPSACECLPYRRGEGCADCVVHVNVASTADPADGKTWETAFPRIQDGVDTAASAAEGETCAVWVAAGQYPVVDFSPLDSLRLRDGVVIRGGYLGTEDASGVPDPEANPTELTGSLPGVTAYHVVTADHVLDAVLDGFVILHGWAIGGDERDQRGAGVYLYGSRVTLRGCRISYNRALRAGGGIFAAGSAVTIEQCRTTFNAAASELGELESSGGAIALDDSNAWISDSRVVSNYATTRGGGLYLRRSTLQSWNLVLAANEAWNEGGGALFSTTTSWVDLVHATVVGNRAAEGGAIYLTEDAGYLRVRSSVVWGNLASDPNWPDILREGSGPSAEYGVSYSVIDATEPYPGTGNSLEDPGLVAVPALDGTWTDDSAYDYVTGTYRFVDDDASFTPGSLVGAFLKFYPTGTEWVPIVGNTEHEVFTEAICSNCLVLAGTAYQIFDLRLAESSRCIDAGDPDPYGLLDHDVEGNPRDTTPDIGAYEHQ